ncbi:unnamed protein product, partial [Prunus brigantina]
MFVLTTWVLGRCHILQHIHQYIMCMNAIFEVTVVTSLIRIQRPFSCLMHCLYLHKKRWFP